MADHDPDRQRLEDMLKASDQHRATSEAPEDQRPATSETPDDQAAKQRDEEPRAERSPESDGRSESGARPARATGSAASKLKAGLIAGGLSVPGALIPILGVLLGIAAIVLGVMVSRQSSDGRAKIAIGLGALGIVLSIALFVLALGSK